MKNNGMRNIIVGTAGHIDHGKTALVRALTGIDTDRLEEEKRRGISIDLGFAHLELGANTRLGLVDVPGHERFIKNMLAGVGGIDLVLFVIAADESIKPQTREHFDICRLLQIKRGIVVLTKADLVDADILELVRLEAEEFVRGSFLEGAPAIAVSAATGQGIAELKAALAAAAAEIAPKDSSRAFRMPVDRVFSVKGFGTVVTGTLISGAVDAEQEVEVYPQRRRVRVRGVEVHGSAVSKALAGQRTALNLAGVDVGELGRGMVLSAPGRFEPTRQVDAAFELLAGALPLKHGAPVHFHAGTAEIEARVRLLDGAAPAMRPGTRAYVQFLLRDPVLLLPGDRFVVRMFSPVVTIGGGEVLDIASPQRGRRAVAAARLRKLEQADAAGRVRFLAGESEFGLSVDRVAARTGMDAAEIVRLAEGSDLLHINGSQPWLLGRPWAEARARAMHARMQTFHRQNPLLAGMPKEELRSRELPGAPPFLLDAIVAMDRSLVIEGDVVRLASHKIAFQQDETEALARIESAFAASGLSVPSTNDVLNKSGVETARARSLLQILLREHKLVRIGDDLVFHREAIAQVRGLLANRRGQRFSVAEFKDWTGISRKYAIPLLEYLDREHVTRREGDQRVVV
jgi:selenocysteine-specific elongation factor